MSLNKGLTAAVLVLAAATALVWIVPPRDGVVVYTSVDGEYAQALADRFTAATGVPVVLRTDSEVSKTTGLLGRLRDLRARPDGDVFWNSELSGTLLLAREGLFAPYVSPAAASIPARFKDAGGLWTGFGCRARVLIYHTGQVKPEAAPRTLEDLADVRWRGRFCLARALFGTTRSHLVSLVLALGEEQGFALLRRLRENGAADGRAWLLDGNAAVRERVAEGYFALGITDTDDVYAALDRNRPVGLVFLEQSPAWPGVFLIPNSVALISGGPHPQAARRFVDFLLRPETEAFLAEQGARQIPVRADVPVPPGRPKLADFHEAAVDPAALAAHLEDLSARIDRLLRGVDP